MASRNRLLILASVFSFLAAAGRGQEVLYGGNGGHSNASSINDGSLVILDQTTAAVTVVGHPADVARLTGIGFDASGTLYASTLPGGGFPPPPPPLAGKLVTLDPNTGALLSTVGPIVEGGTPIAISDIAFQPGTDTLFGVRARSDEAESGGLLYTIDRATGAATLVGDTNAAFATITFGPDGTLYESGAMIGGSGPTNPTIRTLNPSNGAVLTSAPTTEYFGALAVRSDGTLFGSTGDRHTIFTINPATGALVEKGDTGMNFVGSLAFRRPVSSSACAPDAHTLCLNNQRFSVSAQWRRNDGSSGAGTAIPLTSDSGYFWFFNSANIELVTKVLNGCGVGGHYWVFAAGLTNVEVTLSVRDTQTGSVKTYVNPLGTAYAPIQDTSAFSTCP